MLSIKSQKEALKSKETTAHLEKSAKRSKSKRSRNQSNQEPGGTLGRLVGMKTTLGASESSLSAT